MEQRLLTLKHEIEKQTRSTGLEGLVDISDRISEDVEKINLRKVDGIYLFAQTQDNEDAVFLSAKNLLERELCKSDSVLVIEGIEANGFPGFKKWYSKLRQDYGIHVLPVDIPNPSGVNTLSESESIVRYAKRSKYDSICVVAPQFHLLRAFMTAASVAMREYPELNVLAYPGVDQDWNQVVYHSQGIVKVRRIDLVKSEIERIKIYQSKCDLETTQRILDYISGRK